MRRPLSLLFVVAFILIVPLTPKTFDELFMALYGKVCIDMPFGYLLPKVFN